MKVRITIDIDTGEDAPETIAHAAGYFRYQYSNCDRAWALKEAHQVIPDDAWQAVEDVTLDALTSEFEECDCHRGGWRIVSAHCEAMPGSASS
jgi:hypothetical protein